MSRPPDSAPADASRRQRESRRSLRGDWRAPQSSGLTLDLRVLAVVLLAGGAGILVAVLVRQSSGAPALLSLAVLWVGLLASIIFAFTTLRLPGLLHFRLSDIVWGAGTALLFRFALSIASHTNADPFPSSASLGDGNAAQWVMNEALPAALPGPLLEEMFFRGILLVIVFRLAHARAGTVAAGVAATLISAGGFVCLHAAFSPLLFEDALGLLALGAVCSILVLLTGRIWGAVVMHITYNGTYLAAVALGALLA